MSTVRADGAALRFSVVGPGKVGSSIARWLAGHGALLTTVAARSAGRAEALATELDGSAVRLPELDSSSDELLLVSTPDATLPAVAERLAERRQAAVVLHVSGATAVEALAPLRAGGSAIGGLHPLRAFPDPSRDPKDAAGLVYAVGGDPRARQLAESIVDSWSGTAVSIEDHQRPLYHLAASISAGGIVTLLATAAEIARRAGLPAAVVGGYRALALQAIGQAGSRPAEAITGPVARGESETLEQQLIELQRVDPDTVDFIARLAGETLRHTGSLADSEQDHSETLDILAKVMERKSFLDQQ